MVYLTQLIMKTTALLLIIFFSLSYPCQSQDANDELYYWQLNEFNKTGNQFSGAIGQQIHYSPKGETPEETYLQQLEEFPNISASFPDEIQGNVDGFFIFPSQMTPEEQLMWQRTGYPKNEQSFSNEFDKAATQSEHLKEIKKSRSN